MSNLIEQELKRRKTKKVPLKTKSVVVIKKGKSFISKVFKKKSYAEKKAELDKQLALAKQDVEIAQQKARIRKLKQEAFNARTASGRKFIKKVSKGTIKIVGGFASVPKKKGKKRRSVQNIWGF